MRLSAVACLALLPACSGETGFHTHDPNNVGEEGDPGAEITPQVLEFADLTLAIAKSRLVQVLSTGEKNLVVYEVSVRDDGGGAFFCEEERDVTVAPGLALEFPVVATLYEDAQVEGSLRIRTNDAEATAFDLPLYAWTEGWASDTGPDDTAP